jgi:hypothetical protein
MDSIDITDSAFSLEVPNVNEVVNEVVIQDMTGGKSDYTMFMYIGIAILLGLIGMVIYKYYQNKKNNQSEQDCPGGFCSMNQNIPRQI